MGQLGWLQQLGLGNKTHWDWGVREMCAPHLPAKTVATGASPILLWQGLRTAAAILTKAFCQEPEDCQSWLAHVLGDLSSNLLGQVSPGFGATHPKTEWMAQGPGDCTTQSTT